MRSSSYVTLIIPTYNSEKYISRTLKCLTEETDPNFQVVIIDDNSTDNTIKIAQEFTKSLRLKIEIKNTKEFKGAAQSLNLTFNSIKTPYFALIDSDAYLDKNWIKETRLILDQGAEITGGVMMAYQNNSLIGYLAGLELESRYTGLKHGQKVIHLPTNNLMGKTEILAGIRLDPKLKYAYDHQLSYLLDQKGVNFILNKKTFCHHHNKTDLFSFIKQQYLVGYNQFRLSVKYPLQAREKDAVSGWYLPLQLFLFILAIILLPLKYQVSVAFLICVILLNSYFLLYLLKKKKWSLFPPAILMIFIRLAVWTVAVLTGLISLVNFS